MLNYSGLCFPHSLEIKMRLDEKGTGELKIGNSQPENNWKWRMKVLVFQNCTTGEN